MKLLLFCAMLAGSIAKATPVLEQGVGTVTPYTVTILPDDQDKNLFYFFPNHYGLSQLGDRKAFSCLQSRLASGASIVECNMIFDAELSTDTTKKIQEIKATIPQAKFSPVPYTKMTIILNKNTHPYLADVECQRNGSETGQEVTCDWKVNPSKFLPFRRMILDNALVEVMQYEAQFIAVVDHQKISVPYTIPIYVSDLGKGDYFFDSNGNVLH